MPKPVEGRLLFFTSELVCFCIIFKEGMVYSVCRNCATVVHPIGTVIDATLGSANSISQEWGF